MRQTVLCCGKGQFMIPNQWYAILPSKAVRAGGVTAVRRMGLELALFRTADGALGCVADRCTHRGAALSRGRVKGGCLQCPFHGLEFAPDGRCAFVPANGRADASDLSRFNVRSYPVREAYGIVYLWYGEAEKASDALPFFPDEIGGGDPYSEMADHWNAHYSRCIENQLDVVHLPFVHRSTIGRGNRTVVNGPKIVPEEDGFRTSANNEKDVGQTPRRAADCVIKPTYLCFRYPNIWLNHISDKLKVLIYFAPVDDENTVLYIRFYCRLSGLRGVDALVAQLGKAGNRIIERQDRRVVVTQQPKPSAYRSQEKLLAGDGPVIQYRRGREERRTQAEQK